MLFIITRFSIPYKESDIPKLNDDDRLNEHLYFFENFTLPSLKKQNDKNFTHYILAGEQLDEYYKNKLDHLVATYKTGEILYAENMDKGLELVKENIKNHQSQGQNRKRKSKLIATTRLDDDDWLNPNFVNLVKQHLITSNIGKFINCPYGKYCHYSNRNLISDKNVYRPKIALGLTFISQIDNLKTIYDQGNHTKLDIRNFILIKEPYMWTYNIHDHNHSGIGDHYESIDEIPNQENIHKMTSKSNSNSNSIKQVKQKPLKTRPLKPKVKAVAKKYYDVAIPPLPVNNKQSVNINNKYIKPLTKQIIEPKAPESTKTIKRYKPTLAERLKIKRKLLKSQHKKAKIKYLENESKELNKSKKKTLKQLKAKQKNKAKGKTNSKTKVKLIENITGIVSKK